MAEVKHNFGSAPRQIFKGRAPIYPFGEMKADSYFEIDVPKGIDSIRYFARVRSAANAYATRHPEGPRFTTRLVEPEDKRCKLKVAVWGRAR